MKHSFNLASFLTASAIAVLIPAQANAQTLPPAVQKAIAEQKDSCKPDTVTIDKGFVNHRDINGDGISDYILNYGSFRCGESYVYFCGSAGCLTQVFASSDGTFVKVLDENVQRVSFKTVKGRPAMLLGLHGSACGKRGVDACGATLYWNGSKFSSAN